LTPDGTTRWRREEDVVLGGDPIAAARALGYRLGAEIREAAGDALAPDPP
jgi:hydroxymethylbilane synthase